MKFNDTPLTGAFQVTTERIGDERGHLARWFCRETLRPVFGDQSVVQINHTLTLQSGALRGLHFQLQPHVEAKLVRCIRGRVWDVAVDLRQEEPTFMRWHAIELSADRMNAFYIPEGCAHGFQALTENCEMLYLHTAAYAPDHEAGLRWDDPRLGIDWPLPVTEISKRDQMHPYLSADFEGIRL